MTPPPNCPHCRAHFDTHLRLDQHLRFECPGLGREDAWLAAATEQADIAAAAIDAEWDLRCGDLIDHL